MSFASLTIDEFLDRLSSAEPGPGGGALAALAGALAAAMLAMVCNLTVGRPRFASVEEELQRVLASVLACRRLLTALADADADAYANVSQANRLPRTTEAEQQARAAAIESSMHRATEVPVATAEAARDVIQLAVQTAEAGNPSVLADVAVAAHLALAAARAAADQARYNLASLTDTAIVATMAERADRVRGDADALAARALDIVDRRLALP